MVLFFGIAAKEIAEACLPGGSLNPPKKAINPLFATLGGVVGPIAGVLSSRFWGGGPQPLVGPAVSDAWRPPSLVCALAGPFR